MKILYVVNEPWFFLSHRLPIGLAAKAQGDTVHVASRAGVSAQEITDMGFTHHVIPLSRSGTSIPSELNSLLAIWKLLRQVKPDVVHLVTIKPVIYGGIAARFAPVAKVVAAVSGLGSLYLAKGFVANLKRNIGTLLYSFALGSKKTTVIFQNPDDRQMFLELGAIKPEQTVLIRGSGIDLNAFSASAEHLTGKPMVTFAARLLFDKGLAEYIDAIKILNDRGVEASYQIVGDLDPGNMTSATAKDIERWQSIDNLTVKGYQKDMVLVFRDSNIVVLPSYREGLPKVLIEAAACGRAVITTDVPGCRDAIEADETGILVSAKSADELADAIEKLVIDTDLRVKMGIAGRKLAEDAFSIEQVVDQHLAIYRQ